LRKRRKKRSIIKCEFPRLSTQVIYTSYLQRLLLAPDLIHQGSAQKLCSAQKVRPESKAATSARKRRHNRRGLKLAEAAQRAVRWIAVLGKHVAHGARIAARCRKNGEPAVRNDAQKPHPNWRFPNRMTLTQGALMLDTAKCEPLKPARPGPTARQRSPADAAPMPPLPAPAKPRWSVPRSHPR